MGQTSIGRKDDGMSITGIDFGEFCTVKYRLARMAEKINPLPPTSNLKQETR